MENSSSMSMVSKNSCSHFSSQRSYYDFTYPWSKFHNEVMSWIAGAFECHYMHGPYMKQTQLLCVIWLYCLWAACPCLSWSAVAMHALTWVVFTPGFFHTDGALWQVAGNGVTMSLWGHSIFVKCSFKIYSIWSQANKQASKHIHAYSQW